MDRWARKVADQHPWPPETPVEDLWRGIASEIEGRAEVGMSGVSSRGEGSARPGSDAGPESIQAVVGRGGSGHYRLVLAAAASLVLGFGLGRGVVPLPGIPSANESPTLVQVDAGSTGEGASTSTPALQVARILADRHFADAAALLTLVHAGDPGALSPERLRVWGRELLNQGRYLANSEAYDPATRQLLQDLQVIMVQLAGLPSTEDWGPDREEVELSLIRDGMDRYQVLQRIDQKLPVTN